MNISKSALFLFVVALLGLAAGVGCGKKRPEGAQKELVVLCGSSFVKPTEQLCSQFTAETGINVVTTVGGSEELLPLVKVGRKGDVLITHDPYLDYAAQAGVLGEHIEVGFVAPVLAVQKGNPRGIKSMEDLARPGLKVAVCGSTIRG
jgi:molybdate transport system substrate-binding protein